LQLVSPLRGAQKARPARTATAAATEAVFEAFKDGTATLPNTRATATTTHTATENIH